MRGVSPALVRKRYLARLVGAVLFASAVGWETRSTLLADDPKEKPKPTQVLTVSHGEAQPRIIVVSLYSEGKLLRSGEIDSKVGTFALWRGLPIGKYEVHFEAKGYKKGIKHILLSEQDAQSSVSAELDQKVEIVLGGGPSIQELQEELNQLKKSNADLNTKLQKLQAEVDQLKKK
jgi:hypothetical protein